MKASLVKLVRQRADQSCEYCRTYEGDHPINFEIDHIVPLCHGGETNANNLALACWICNSFKGPNLAGIDRRTNRIVRLFHPRRDRWSDHFHWKGSRLIGRTAIGRATIYVLRINLDERIAHRAILRG